MKYYHTGIVDLDRVLGGGLPENAITLLCGRPGMGKTTIAAQLAVEIAKLGTRVLYVDLGLNEPVLAYFISEAQKNGNVKKHLDYHGITFGAAGVGAVCEAVFNSNAEVVFIDYIQLVGGLDNGVLEFATKGLNDKTFVWLSQLPRSVDMRERGLPVIEDTRGLVHFGGYADKTIMLYRDQLYSDSYDKSKDNEIKLFVFDGATYSGQAVLSWEPDVVREPFFRPFILEEEI